MFLKVNSNSHSQAQLVYSKLHISSQQVEQDHLLLLLLQGHHNSSNRNYSKFKDPKVFEVKCCTKLNCKNIKLLANKQLELVAIWFTSINQLDCSNSNNNSSNRNFKQDRHNRSELYDKQTKVTKEDS